MTSKTNGRRGWRKWAKSRRRRMNAHHRKLYRGAIMRKKQPEREPLPPKLFTPRFLVGMSQGARKRAYRKAVIALEHSEVWRGDVVDRSRFRIGQKLRLCPGCADCSPNRKLYRIQTTNRVLQTTAGSAYPLLTEAGIIKEERCGGSKLIPARKGNRKP